MAVGGRITSWKAVTGEREFASSDRAGGWARGEAMRRQYAFARRAWKGLIVAAVAPWLESPLLLLLAPAPRWLGIGAMAASTVWIVAWVVVMGSGTAPMRMGELGEQWTAKEVHALRRAQWKVIQRAL